MGEHRLTKSDFVDGMRCDKLLWLARHRPELRAAPTPDVRRRLAQGTEVGQRARERYPGGRLIVGNPFDLERARGETRAALEGDVPAMFEAVFELDDVLVVVDVLERDPDEPGAWRLAEVKATNELKDEHLPDAAVQAHVLRGCGLEVTRASVLHLDRDFVAPDGGELFVAEDVTEATRALDVGAEIARQRAVLATPEAPDVLIGSHCRRPHPCPFLETCWAPFGTDTVFHVPKTIHPTRMRKLREMGIVRLEELGEDAPLSEAEREGVELVLRRERRVDHEALRALLEELEPPLHFFDLETIDDALPRLPGTRPYQKVPFQFSCHVLHSGGRLEHAEYLHEDLSDPRPPLAEALARAFRPEGSIVVYHASFERGRLQELARDLPQHAAWIEAAVARLWDQERAFRGPWVDWRFHGSTSIKKVLPVLCPDLSYDGMPVSNGTEAMAAWEDVIHGRNPDPGKALAELRAYCAQDTYAMVRLHEVLAAEV